MDGVNCSYTGTNIAGKTGLPNLRFVESHLPHAAGTIFGPSTVQQGQANLFYSTTGLQYANVYTWTLPDGATITSGFNMNNILVSYSPTASSGIMRVCGTNATGSGAPSPDFPITVSMANSLALTNLVLNSGQTSCYNAASTITVAGSGTTFIVHSGGSATMIAGLSIDYLPGTKVESGGYMHGYIAPSGPFCTPPSIPQVITSEEETASSNIPSSFFKVYPNPTPGKFTLELQGDEVNPQAVARIYNMMGTEVLTQQLRGPKTEFSLESRSPGIYIVSVYQNGKMETAKIIRQ